MTLERVGLIVGGSNLPAGDPWFALAYFPAYGGIDDIPPPWRDWVDWPVLISGDAESAYNGYGVIFGVGLVVVVVSLAVLVRHSTVKDTGIRGSWIVIVGGLSAVAVGSLLEYGFGDYIDPSFGFFAELLGFVAVMVGTGLLGRFLRKEADLGMGASVGVGVSGFVAIVIGVLLVGHLPSGPALIPVIVAVIFGSTGLPEAITMPVPDTRPRRPIGVGDGTRTACYNILVSEAWRSCSVADGRQQSVSPRFDDPQVSKRASAWTTSLLRLSDVCKHHTAREAQPTPTPTTSVNNTPSCLRTNSRRARVSLAAIDLGGAMKAESYWPMVVVLMMFAFWARATYGVGLTAIIMGVWLLMGTVAGATWVVKRWNRWWVWGVVSVGFVVVAAIALEFITIVEEF